MAKVPMSSQDEYIVQNSGSTLTDKTATCTNQDGLDKHSDVIVASDQVYEMSKSLSPGRHIGKKGEIAQDPMVNSEEDRDINFVSATLDQKVISQDKPYNYQEAEVCKLLGENCLTGLFNNNKNTGQLVDRNSHEEISEIVCQKGNIESSTDNCQQKPEVNHGGKNSVSEITKGDEKVPLSLTTVSTFISNSQNQDIETLGDESIITQDDESNLISPTAKQQVALGYESCNHQEINVKINFTSDQCLTPLDHANNNQQDEVDVNLSKNVAVTDLCLSSDNAPENNFALPDGNDKPANTKDTSNVVQEQPENCHIVPVVSQQALRDEMSYLDDNYQVGSEINLQTEREETQSKNNIDMLPKISVNSVATDEYVVPQDCNFTTSTPNREQIMTSANESYNQELDVNGLVRCLSPSNEENNNQQVSVNLSTKIPVSGQCGDATNICEVIGLETIEAVLVVHVLKESDSPQVLSCIDQPTTDIEMSSLCNTCQDELEINLTDVTIQTDFHADLQSKSSADGRDTLTVKSQNVTEESKNACLFTECVGVSKSHQIQLQEDVQKETKIDIEQCQTKTTSCERLEFSQNVSNTCHGETEKCQTTPSSCERLEFSKSVLNTCQNKIEVNLTDGQIQSDSDSKSCADGRDTLTVKSQIVTDDCNGNCVCNEYVGVIQHQQNQLQEDVHEETKIDIEQCQTTPTSGEILDFPQNASLPNKKDMICQPLPDICDKTDKETASVLNFSSQTQEVEISEMSQNHSSPEVTMVLRESLETGILDPKSTEQCKSLSQESNNSLENKPIIPDDLWHQKPMVGLETLPTNTSQTKMCHLYQIDPTLNIDRNATSTALEPVNTVTQQEIDQCAIIGEEVLTSMAVDGSFEESQINNTSDPNSQQLYNKIKDEPTPLCHIENHCDSSTQINNSQKHFIIKSPLKENVFLTTTDCGETDIPVHTSRSMSSEFDNYFYKESEKCQHAQLSEESLYRQREEKTVNIEVLDTCSSEKDTQMLEPKGTDVYETSYSIAEVPTDMSEKFSQIQACQDKLNNSDDDSCNLTTVPVGDLQEESKIFQIADSNHSCRSEELQSCPPDFHTGISLAFSEAVNKISHKYSPENFTMESEELHVNKYLKENEEKPVQYLNQRQKYLGCDGGHFIANIQFSVFNRESSVKRHKSEDTIVSEESMPISNVHSLNEKRDLAESSKSELLDGLSLKAYHFVPNKDQKEYITEEVFVKIPVNVDEQEDEEIIENKLSVEMLIEESNNIMESRELSPASISFSPKSSSPLAESLLSDRCYEDCSYDDLSPVPTKVRIIEQENVPPAVNHGEDQTVPENSVELYAHMPLRCNKEDNTGHTVPEAEVPQKISSALFNWQRSGPQQYIIPSLCNDDNTEGLSTLPYLPPLKTCSKPRRVGLSRKYITQPLHSSVNKSYCAPVLHNKFR